jgi:DNA/RNA-binding domain of Phe-tRNA-synthetase-like protein
VTVNPPPIQVTVDAKVRDLRLGIVAAIDMVIAPAQEPLRAWCANRIQAVVQQGMAGGEPRREAVRAMLRLGGFKPAGRNKPAQEYLFRTITETDTNTLPMILNAVDALNVISLQSGLPISLLAVDRTGPQVIVRYGEPGERFVFNRSGQELELEGLICVCSAAGSGTLPLGTPIKDSMLGKVTELDRQVLAVIYAPSTHVSPDELGRWSRELATAFRDMSPGATTFEFV